jgi:hypothetical protein
MNDVSERTFSMISISKYSIGVLRIHKWNREKDIGDHERRKW